MNNSTTDAVMSSKDTATWTREVLARTSHYQDGLAKAAGISIEQLRDYMEAVQPMSGEHFAALVEAAAAAPWHAQHDPLMYKGWKVLVTDDDQQRRMSVDVTRLGDEVITAGEAVRDSQEKTITVKRFAGVVGKQLETLVRFSADQLTGDTADDGKHTIRWNVMNDWMRNELHHYPVRALGGMKAVRA